MENNKSITSILESMGELFNELTVAADELIEKHKEEVEQRLIEEAKRRYNIGQNITLNKYSAVINDFVFKIDNSGNVHCHTDGYVFMVFDAEFGKWAEIIEEPLTLNGKEVIVYYDDDAIGIFGGCYNLQGIKEMIKHVDGLDIENIIKDGIDYYVPDLRELLTKIEERENR